MSSIEDVHYHPGSKDEDLQFIIHTDKFTAYVILDGHGFYAREFVASAKSILSRKLLEFNEESYNDSLIRIFEETNTEVYKEIFIRTGATLTVVIITATHMYVANAGDSDALLFTKDKTIKKLNADHSGLSCDEMLRLRSSYPETRIMYDSKTPRMITPVWSLSNEIIPMDNRYHYAKNRSYEPAIYIIYKENKLAMTRSIGDYYMKLGGVIAKPSISVREKPTTDEILLVASDGFWDGWTKPELAEHLKTDPASVFAKSIELNHMCFGSSADDNSLIMVKFL